MARIRSIKPEFWDDEDLKNISFLARLVFIGLWNQADRLGRVEDRPGRLRARLFPYEDNVDVASALEELARWRYIERYEVDGRPFLQVRTFLEHQRPHPKEPPSRLPGLDHPSATRKIVERHGEPRHDTANQETIPDGAAASRVDLGREGDLGEGGGDTPPADPTHSLTLTRGQLRQSVGDLVALWNEDIPEPLKPVATLLQSVSENRIIAALRARPDLDWWRTLIADVRASDWLSGRIPGKDGKPFVADLWWVLAHVDEIASGRYVNRSPLPSAPAEATPTAPGVPTAQDSRAYIARLRNGAAHG